MLHGTNSFPQASETELVAFRCCTSCFRLFTYLIENAVELEKIVLHHDVHFWDVPAQKSIEEKKMEDEERNRATQQLKAKVPSRIQFVCLLFCKQIAAGC